MPSSPQIELLYHRRGAFPQGSRFKWHEHPFWQLEISLSSGIEVLLDTQTLLLAPGDCFIIAPRQKHCFRYTAPSNSYLSIKYNLIDGIENPRTGHIENTELLTLFTQLLQNLIPEGEHPPLENAAVIRQVVESLLTHFNESSKRKTAEHSPQQTHLASRVLNIIEKNKGCTRRVDEVAHQLGISQSHLRSQFKKETGATLKSKLDASTMEQARFLLHYSGSSISEIATTLGFSDLFSFSRFFKTHQGVPPRHYRNTS
ncbi:MAG: AraC family transcriptional regulator [Opitutaceae bacterium]